MKSFIISLCYLSTLLTSCKKGEPSPPVTSGENDFSALTTIVEDHLSQLGGDAGLLIMDRAGTILFKQYFGAYSDDSYIPIASGAKLPSMAVILSLVDEGKLSLDDKVSKYYPTEYASPDRRNVTLRQLMSHTSGFSGNSRWIGANNISLQEAVKGIGQGGMIAGNFVSEVPMPYLPSGTQFAYGGVSMQIAGGIAEVVSGKSWDVLFKERIADKCQMAHTNYTAFGPTTNFRIAGGAGTTMMDYGRFLLMLLNDGQFNGVQVLSKNMVNEMMKDQVSEATIVETPYEGDPIRQDYRYGFGCWIEEVTNGTSTIISDQGAFGFSPWIDKEKEIIGILFVKKSLRAVNTQPTPPTAPYTLIRKKVNEILGK